MVLLSLFYSKQKIRILCMGIFLSCELASADSLSLFNPNTILKNPDSLTINTQTLLANDAFSLEGLFDDFHGDFHSQSSDYFAVGDIRYDIGTYIDEVGYIGYTYRKEAVIKTSSGFNTNSLSIAPVMTEYKDLGEKFSLKLSVDQKIKILETLKPKDVHVDVSGRIFVTDSQPDTLVVFDGSKDTAGINPPRLQYMWSGYLGFLL